MKQAFNHTRCTGLNFAHSWSGSDFSVNGHFSFEGLEGRKRTTGREGGNLTPNKEHRKIKGPISSCRTEAGTSETNYFSLSKLASGLARGSRF